jgi:hypothetical protein
MTKQKNNLFLVVWDMLGLETVIDLTAIEQRNQVVEQERLVKILSDPDGRDPGNSGERNLGSIVNAILLRARMNSQRSYEVYTVQTVDGITEQDIQDMFENDPQGSADLIRDRGVKIYSDRLPKNTRVIV